MANSNSGKWVSRVGSQGGGKTYAKSRPSNFYAALVLIVVVGLAIVVYSRFEYQNPTKAHTTTVAPRIGSTLYAGLAIEACGKTLPYLNPDPTSKLGGFIVQSDDIIKVSPTTAADAGDNATVYQFAKEFPGLLASKTELAVPTATGASDAATTYKNGDTCAATSKYPGQKGKVVYAYWSTVGQTKPKLTTNPALIKFTKELRVTMAFEPKGVTPTSPNKTTVDGMFLAETTPATTTTLVPTTTVPLTTTTAPTTTTTKG